MKKYDGHAGVINKFGKKWRWTRIVRHDFTNDQPIEIFKVEPWYEFDPMQPRWRAGEEDTLTLIVGVRGNDYIFPAIRLPCPVCDGGIRLELKLTLHGGICYCDKQDFTVVECYEARMTDEQKIVYATYHLDRMMCYAW